MAFAPYISTRSDAKQMLFRVIAPLLLDTVKRAGLSTAPVSRIVERAKDVIDRVQSLTITDSGAEAVFLSSEAVEEGVERVEEIKSLTGEVVKIRTGVPIEEALHKTVLGPGAAKCSCIYSVVRGARAARLVRGNRELEEVCERYVLCKHLAALAAIVAAIRGLKLGEMRALRAAALVTTAAELGDSRGIEEALRILKRR